MTANLMGGAPIQNKPEVPNQLPGVAAGWRVPFACALYSLPRQSRVADRTPGVGCKLCAGSGKLGPDHNRSICHGTRWFSDLAPTE
jgi:hypothetical protein